MVRPTQDTPEADPRRLFEELLAQSHERAAVYLNDHHPGDVARWLEDVGDEDTWLVFSALGTEFQADVVEHAEDELREELVAHMSAGDLRELVEELPSDEAVDLLAEADDRVAQDVLAGLDEEAAQELRQLRSYDPESAGGLMATEVVTVEESARLADAVKAIKRLGEDAEEELGVFVIDEQGRPVGYLSDRALLTHPIHDAVIDVMVQAFTLEATADQEDVARAIEKYGLQAVGVVDPEGALIGVISAEDAAEVIGEEAEEDIARIVGTSPGHQQTRLPVLTRVRQRLPLMMLTLGGGLLSAKILSYFTGASAPGAELNSTADILRYLPLIIGLAGNVGVQSSTILVRAFATGEVEDGREMSVLAGEISVGALIGLLCGFAVTFVSSLLEVGSLVSSFGLAVGISTAVSVAFAAVAGSTVPTACRRIGIDPAIVAGPFLICVSDLAGSLIYIVTAQELVGL